MIKKCFRPFWSYDVQATELWLAGMAGKGWHLVAVDFVKRIFSFEKSEPKKAFYRIQYERLAEQAIPAGLANARWKKISFNSRWLILENDKSMNQVKTIPVRDRILRRNSIILYVTGMCLFVEILLIPLVFVFLIFAFVDRAVRDVSGIIGLVVSILLIPSNIFVIYTIIRLIIGNKRLHNESSLRKRSVSINSYRVAYDIKTGKRLTPDYKTIVRVRLAWIYSPDRTEQWLEKMSLCGFHLYELGFFGNSFYFIKGDSRKIKYCLDYQNYASDEYVSIHMQSGWRQIEIASWRLMKWTIWVKEYDGDVEPAFYSTKSDQLKNARRIALGYSLYFFPICILYIFLLVSQIRDDFLTGINWRFSILLSLMVLEFGSFAIRSVLYYFRLKKKVNREIEGQVRFHD